MDVTVPLTFSVEGTTVGRDYGDNAAKALHGPLSPFHRQGEEGGRRPLG